MLTTLVQRVPGIQRAMLSTPDGFNLCAVGAGEDEVSRLAALTSSLHAVAGASVGTARGGAALDHLTLVSGDTTKVLIGVPHRGLGQLLLAADGAGVALGVILVGVRSAGVQLGQLLGDVLPPDHEGGAR